MFSVAPASVMLLGVLGLLVIAFATTRMAFLERKTRLTTYAEPERRQAVRSTV
jgi:hypothetical protein